VGMIGMGVVVRACHRAAFRQVFARERYIIL
jgi:hypothetical protein